MISGSDDFCVGRSAQALAPSASPTLRIRDHMARPLGELFNTIAAATLPVFAAVKGRAFGFGCALAGICDVTFAHPQATFALPEIGHDVPPTMAMRALLGKVDIKTLAYWTLSGRSFDAQQARACGLVTAVSDNPEAEALALARDLGRSGLRTVASIKTFLTSVHAQSAPTSHLAEELIATALVERDRTTKI